MARIFISYRREDTSGYAGRLYDRLSQHFGPEQVFMDIDALEPGVDFVAVIEEAVSSCEVLVALIGDRWLTVTDREGRKRLDNPDDFVRLEIKAALDRDIRVIPALVRGASMPRADQLPDVLAGLARRQAIEISDQRFHHDVDRLIAVLERALDKPAPPKPRQPFEPEMVHIPAGPFLFGTSDEQIAWLVKNTDWAQEWVEKGRFDKEKPLRTITLPDYAIGKYPVTVGEYRHFIKANSYTERRYWTDAGWSWHERKNISMPGYWDNEIWVGDDRLPIGGVSWYEAVAYCRWFSEATGHEYHLPTEAEWEKAARGKNGRIYPCGDTFAANRGNVWETGIGQTTPVGSYPMGASPYDILDMSGNVWEWCASKWVKRYTHPEDNNITGDDVRVLRGGSFCDGLGNARCASRDSLPPDARFYNLGFRVVCASLM